MVRAGLPEGIVSLHSLKTDENILHGVVQCMAHVELSRDIWGRNYNGKRGFAVVYFCMEVFFIQPLLVQSVFYALRVIGLCQFFAHTVFMPFFLFYIFIFANKNALCLLL